MPAALERVSRINHRGGGGRGDLKHFYGQPTTLDPSLNFFTSLSVYTDKIMFKQKQKKKNKKKKHFFLVLTRSQKADGL